MIETILPPIIALYAETHFRFWGWAPSALFRREPEIVFDLPRRLARGRDLPVALMINDASRYPVDILSAHIAVSRSGGTGGGDGAKPLLFEFDRRRIEESAVDHPLKKHAQAYLLTVPRAELGAAGGEVFVNACLRYRRVNRKGVPEKGVRVALNDNLVTSTKYSYRCFIAEDDYPGADMCAFGDLHCHSIFSRSHVEWGPPLEVIGRVAAASGIGFVAVTDHSYDLACEPDNFLRQDRDLRLWDMYRSSIEGCAGPAALIPAEEVSVLNSKGRVVHLCGLGVREYIPGTLDGARRNIHVNRQLTIGEAAAEIARQGGVAFAAHPGARAGLAQGIFLRRGAWSDDDLRGWPGGVQAANSGFSESWIRGKRLWVNMLLRGQKPPLLAGSDAHGDFNRYRAIGVPFVQIYEGAERYMGFARTGVYGNRRNAGEIIDGIKDAATFVSSGPFVSICDARRPEESLIGVKPVSANDAANLRARAVSTKEFGPLESVRVITGRQGGAEEAVIVKETFTDGTFEATIPIPADKLPESGYLRVEARGKSPRGLPTDAATSACFV